MNPSYHITSSSQFSGTPQSTSRLGQTPLHLLSSLPRLGMHRYHFSHPNPQTRSHSARLILCPRLRIPPPKTRDFIPPGGNISPLARVYLCVPLLPIYSSPPTTRPTHTPDITGHNYTVRHSTSFACRPSARTRPCRGSICSSTQ